MSYNFHIGQDIVALNNHAGGRFKKDDVFVVKSLRCSFCKCNKTLVDIGFNSLVNSTGRAECMSCGHLEYKGLNIHWFNSSNFAPLDTLTSIDELKEILEQPLFQL